MLLLLLFLLVVVVAVVVVVVIVIAQVYVAGICIVPLQSASRHFIARILINTGM